MEKNGIKKINPLYSLNKWDVYQKLLQFEEIRPHLPLTKVYTKPRDLKIMFRKSSEVYIKACKGDSGNGVIRVKKLDEGGYEYCYSQQGKLHVRQVKKRRTLIKELKIYFQEKNFIVQHAIPLLRIDHRIVDLRAEVQRNRNGKLGVRSIVVRIAKKGSPITNVQSRPSVYVFQNFISTHPQLFQIEISALKQRIEKFLIDVYLSMEKLYGTFGEIGIDFGLDTDGTVWFIECNARSAKVAAYLTKDKKMIRQIFLNPLEYAKFIYGICKVEVNVNECLTNKYYL